MEKGSCVNDGFPNEVTPGYSNSTQLVSTPAPIFRTRFASVSLHMWDRIRLVRFPESDVSQIQGIVNGCWPKGIQELRVYDESNEIKVHGNPWSHSWSHEKVDARRLVCGLLHGLFDMGWVLKAALDITKKEFNKEQDTLLFRKQQPPPLPCIWMSISFDRADLLHLIDAPVELSHSLVRALGSKVQRFQNQGTVFEIKFHGYPWRESGTATVRTRVILLVLLEVLEQHGFSLYASIDQDNGPGGNSHALEADTWFCCREAAWTPGAFIYSSLQHLVRHKTSNELFEFAWHERLYGRSLN